MTCDRSVKANIVNTLFSRNEAKQLVGGLGVEFGDNVYINMENISCVGNTAGLVAGCIGSRDGAIFKINGSRFNGNSAGLGLADGLGGEGSSFEVR